MSNFSLRRGALGSARTTSIDRTGEFRHHVENVYKTQGGVIPPSEHLRAEESMIGQCVTYLSGLHKNIVEHLKEMSNVLRRSTVQSLSIQNVESLTEEISRKLKDLGTGCDTLEQAVAEQRSSVPAHVYEHYRIMSQALKNRLMTVSKEFGKLLEQQQKNIIKQNERAKKYTYQDPRDLEGGLTGEDDHDIGPGLQSEYHRSRREGMRTIQTALYDVSQLFSRVSTMVAQQNEFVESIYSEVDTASWNLRAGEAELKKYLNNLSGSKWLIIKIFVIFISFLIFFIVFIL